MYKGKTICVVVPAYNEEKLISRVIETMPGYVDKIVVVDDKSKDGTSKIVNSYANKLNVRLVLIQHKANQGVGGAIVTGYRWARRYKMDITIVMAGDAQMDYKDLPSLLEPIVKGESDYVKGNRLFNRRAWEIIPKWRYLGNSFLSLFTKIASGYWHIADSQCGYTAITLDALQNIRLNRIYKRYGMPNDMLVHLNVGNFRVKDVPVKPIYDIGEKSGIRLWKVIPTLSWLIIKRFFWRLKEKYVIRDFHPLVFFYLMGLTLLPIGVFYGVFILFSRLILRRITENQELIRFCLSFSTPMAGMFVIILIVTGLQMLFFAMWFDMDYNKELK